MPLEIIVLSKMNQTQEDEYNALFHIWNLYKKRDCVYMYVFICMYLHVCMHI